MCSGSEAGSYLRLIDFVYHSTLGLRVIRKKKRSWHTERFAALPPRPVAECAVAVEGGRAVFEDCVFEAGTGCAVLPLFR